MAAGFSDEAAPSVDSPSISDVLVGSVLYFVQSASTSPRESAGRFSRLATRLSKQYAQWAWVAMVLVVREARRESGRAENRWRALWAFRTNKKTTRARKRASRMATNMFATKGTRYDEIRGIRRLLANQAAGGLCRTTRNRNRLGRCASVVRRARARGEYCYWYIVLTLLHRL